MSQPLPQRTVFPADLERNCPFQYVDRAPHHYRIQGWRWDGYMHNADMLADTAADAEIIRAHLESQGYRNLNVLAPQCSGLHVPDFTLVQAWGDVWTIVDNTGRNVYEIANPVLAENALIETILAGSLEAALAAQGFDSSLIEG
jgi:hypothetical protein